MSFRSLAINPRGAAVDDAPNTNSSSCFQDINGSADVDTLREVWFLKDGFHVGDCGEVIDGVDAV